MKKIFLLLILAIVPGIAQNNFEMGIKVTNSNGDTINRALFGIKPNATNNIDKELGEFDFPSLLPSILSSAFRFYDSNYEDKVLSYYDFRPDFETDKDSIVYNFEVSGIINEFKLEWGEFPAGIKSAIMRSKYLSDSYNYYDMKTVKSVDVKNSAVTDFTIVLRNYDPTNSVEEYADLVQIFPNPAENHINIVANINIAKIEITDIFGKKYDIKVDNNIINLEKLATGVYSIVIITADKHVIRKNIIKI